MRRHPSENKNAGADDGADAQRDQVSSAQRTFQAMLARFVRPDMIRSSGFLANRFAIQVSCSSMIRVADASARVVASIVAASIN